MWRANNNGDKEFSGGKNAWQLAVRVATQCQNFFADDEDEQIADDPVSCYNCRFRRWTADTFVCRKV